MFLKMHSFGNYLVCTVQYMSREESETRNRGNDSRNTIFVLSKTPILSSLISVRVDVIDTRRPYGE